VIGKIFPQKEEPQPLLQLLILVTLFLTTDRPDNNRSWTLSKTTPIN